ncbi:MAG TPA: hypothetical protein VLT86_18235 [Vicinamibacterales bacterium]|nr:hypothetical protein [Vicinamibacterales bacterium]
MVAMLVLVPVLAVLVSRIRPQGPGSDVLIVGLFALGCAAVIGVPVLHWAIEHRRTRAWQLGLLGGVAGLLPPALLLTSGALGLAGDGGFDYVRWVFAHGASIPWYGLMTWSGFSVLTGECVLIGMASGALASLGAAGERHGRREQ